MTTIDGQIYQGDCMDIAEQIETNSVDLILCDPPYGIMKNDTRARLNGGMKTID